MYCYKTIFFKSITFKLLLFFLGNGPVKMPPRVSLRRAFLCVLCCGGALLLVSLHQRWTWPPGQTIIAPPSAEAEVAPPPPELQVRHNIKF